MPAATLHPNVPTNYQEWIECFSILQSGKAESAYIASLRHGALSAEGAVLMQFETRLIKTLNDMLNHLVRRFRLQFSQAQEIQDYDSVRILYHRLLDDVHNCLFFEDLGFLPPAFREELAESVRQQMRDFTGAILRGMGEGDEDLSPAAEDMIFLIKRLSMLI